MGSDPKHSGNSAVRPGEEEEGRMERGEGQDLIRRKRTWLVVGS